jgi:hypothetical protein
MALWMAFSMLHHVVNDAGSSGKIDFTDGSPNNIGNISLLKQNRFVVGFAGVDDHPVIVVLKQNDIQTVTRHDSAEFIKEKIQDVTQFARAANFLIDAIQRLFFFLTVFTLLV